jgi:GMP synthase (glutamine-hydrolysing)
MRILYVQHVPFETPGVIVDWALEMNYPLSGTRLYDGEVLPDAGAFDFLVIMGGPMGVRDEHAHPWLAGEKRFIEQTIRAGKKVLGICLGAQLIAEVLGARVYRNTHREIGWFPVRLTARGAASPVFGVLPGGFDAFHWHGDTFTLPAGCVHAAESEAC